MIRWTGWTTDGKKIGVIKCRTYCELFNTLVSSNIISSIDDEPYLMEMAKKNNINYEDFFNEDGDLIFDDVFTDYNLVELTEADYLQIIKSHDEMAFYQEITEYE